MNNSAQMASTEQAPGSGSPVSRSGRVLRILGAAWLLGVFSAGAAGETGQDRLQLHGFGTLGAVHNSSDRLNFLRDVSQPDRTGRQSVFSPDSRIALQANFQATPELELVGQIVGRSTAPGTSMGDRVEWAFAGYYVNPDLRLRMGRVGADVFLLSDLRNVGFSYPWVRPVPELYGWIPLFSIEGADLERRWQLPDANWRVKFAVGSTRTRIPAGEQIYDFQARDIASGSVVWEAEPWEVKASMMRLTIRSEVPFQPLRDGLAQFQNPAFGPIAASASALLSDIAISGGTVHYMALGGTYDRGPWWGQAEIAVVKGNRQIIPQGKRFYASLGHRFGPVLVHGTVARSTGRYPPREAPAWLPVLTPLLGPEGAYRAQLLADGAVLTANGSRTSQRSVGLGVRWDVRDRTAVKLQWDRSWVDADGAALWTTRVDRPGSVRADVISVSLDFMF